MTMKTKTFFFFFLFLLLGVANAPPQHATLLEALLGRLDDIIQELETIAGNVKPPLPSPLMAAAILFVFCTTIPARLAAAWGCLVRWAWSVFNPPAAAPPKGHWALGASRLVLWMDGVLSPLKLEDWQERAKIAETAAAIAATQTVAAKLKANDAEERAKVAEEKAKVAEEKLDEALDRIERALTILAE